MTSFCFTSFRIRVLKDRKSFDQNCIRMNNEMEMNEIKL